MRRAVVGIVAHVDAGKTTLAEALLYRAGAIRKLGRVDRGDAHLDATELEQRRGITIFANQASLAWGDLEVVLVDAPGHVDFSAEAERTLQVLDYAIVVVGANGGVQAHTRTMWRLLERHAIPTFVFVNKMDLPGADRAALLEQLQQRLSPACLDLAASDFDELAAMGSEEALDEYLETGTLAPATLQELVAQRAVVPVVFGAALRLEGVDALLDALAALCRQRAWPDEFAARVYKVTHDARGERQTWLKVTGGELRARQVLEGGGNAGMGGRPAAQREKVSQLKATGGSSQARQAQDGGFGAAGGQTCAWREKVAQLRVCRGVKLEPADRAEAGELCMVTGLSQLLPGDVLGAEPPVLRPALEPVLAYQVLPEGCDVHALLAALRTLAEEDPMLRVAWSEELQEVQVQLMGAVQREVVADTLRERFGLAVGFGPGGIRYRETIDAPVVGVGHFEPLRHYAEAHLLLEPLPRGSGVAFGSSCPEDDLDRNWQRLILTNAMEREHLGVLTGSVLTDVRITLLAGRAHPKHTEGGDFRQATYRAIRQGLMLAREAGACVLLEPWYRFALEVPAARVGRALADLQRMCARFGAPVAAGAGDLQLIEGEVPVSEVREYALEVAAYTAGTGTFACEVAGYEPCHDAERVVAERAYDPEADLPNTPDSVFCAHGAGYTVKWYDVRDHMHVEDEGIHRTPWREADAAFFGA